MTGGTPWFGFLGRLDVVSALSVLAVALFVIPARLVFGPLGAAGTPAKIVGLLMFLWWGVERLIAGFGGEAFSPLRRALFVLLAAILASYLVATTRPMDGSELRSADRSLISLLSWLGVVLICGEIIGGMARLDALLRRLVMLGGALAVLGLVQFFTKQEWTNYLQIPGLSANADVIGVTDRAGFARPAGTATHPIEFGVVLTVVLPLAIHYALHDRQRHWFRRAVPIAAISLAIPISISRSAVLGTGIVLLVMIPTWEPALRRKAYVALTAALVMVYLAVPGLLGTFRGLFTGIGNDKSAASRTDSYGLAFSYVERWPVFGRGFGTFMPSYRILDNQFLGFLIDTGFVGLTALLSVFVVAVVVARRVRRMTVDPSQRSLAIALCAGVLAAASSFATFDAFSFPMLATLLFLVLGALDALWRTVGAENAVAVARQTAESRGAEESVGHGASR